MDNRLRWTRNEAGKIYSWSGLGSVIWTTTKWSNKVLWLWEWLVIPPEALTSFLWRKCISPDWLSRQPLPPELKDLNKWWAVFAKYIYTSWGRDKNLTPVSEVTIDDALQFSWAINTNGWFEKITRDEWFCIEFTDEHGVRRFFYSPRAIIQLAEYYAPSIHQEVTYVGEKNLWPAEVWFSTSWMLLTKAGTWKIPVEDGHGTLSIYPVQRGSDGKQVWSTSYCNNTIMSLGIEVFAPLIFLESEPQWAYEKEKEKVVVC